MITLDAATKSLEFKLSGAVATTELPFVASYVDIQSSDQSVSANGSNDGTSNGATAVTIVAAPASGHTRAVKDFTIYNADTAAITVTLQVNNGGTPRIIDKIGLSPGDCLKYGDGGFSVITGVNIFPLAPALGGTGTATNTAHGVLVGEGVAAIVAVVGTDNLVLHGHTGADPSFSAVVEADLGLTDVTTGDVSSTKHGFAPKSPASAAQFLNGAATPAFAAVKDSDLSTSDITTNNVSSTKHGFAPKSPADATQFMNGASTPAFAAVKDSDLSTTDITTNNVSSTKHGFAPKSPADATQFMNGAATPAFAAVKDSDLSTSDITTNNVSTSKHGFAPKVPNDATKYLDGTGAYSVPAGSSGTWTTFTPTWAPTSGTLTGGSLNTARYLIVGKTMYVVIYFGNFSLSSTPSRIDLTIPASAVSNTQSQLFGTISDNGTTVAGSAIVVAVGGTVIQFYHNQGGSGNWAASTANSGIFISLFFEIQ